MYHGGRQLKTAPMTPSSFVEHVHHIYYSLKKNTKNLTSVIRQKKRFKKSHFLSHFRYKISILCLKWWIGGAWKICLSQGQPDRDYSRNGWEDLYVDSTLDHCLYLLTGEMLQNETKWCTWEWNNSHPKWGHKTPATIFSSWKHLHTTDRKTVLQTIYLHFRDSWFVILLALLLSIDRSVFTGPTTLI